MMKKLNKLLFLLPQMFYKWPCLSLEAISLYLQVSIGSSCQRYIQVFQIYQIFYQVSQDSIRILPWAARVCQVNPAHPERCQSDWGETGPSPASIIPMETEINFTSLQPPLNSNLRLLAGFDRCGDSKWCSGEMLPALGRLWKVIIPFHEAHNFWNVVWVLLHKQDVGKPEWGPWRWFGVHQPGGCDAWGEPGRVFSLWRRPSGI